MGIFIVIFFCFRNYMRARAQALSGVKWGFYTFLAVIAGWLAGSMIMVIILMIRFPELLQLAGSPDITPQEVSAFILERVNPIVADIFMLFCGLGGYLFVRHRLIKMTSPPPSP
jgi:hypothetical protein